MNINEILRKKGMTKYALAVQSGVPHATLNNICSGKARIEKCSAETLYKLARVLGVTIEDLIVDSLNESERESEVIPFELFKSNVCHQVKKLGDIPFVISTLKSGDIIKYYDEKRYLQAFYLLAMVDYLSRVNGLPQYNAYDTIRSHKLVNPVFPSSIVARAKAAKDDSIMEKSLQDSIPEFRRYNIAEREIRNVY